MELTDNNNNVTNQASFISINGPSKRNFVERHLFVLDKEFLVIPNGGSGDCMFKAVCQALNKGEELKHTEVRSKVVEFIVNKRWDKFKESIEVQHIHGNKHLLQNWNTDPIKTYQLYMISIGTLGSSSELNAAGELFQYNFATIQEYSASSGKIYRIENCCHFTNAAVPFHYFFFTGDFDNGHWEYLEPLQPLSISSTVGDGVYQGAVKIFIDGKESSLDSWLKVHTENTNDKFRLTHSSFRYPFKTTPFPFEWEAFRYQKNGTVLLEDNLYRITKTSHTDLFTVLASLIVEDSKKDSVIDQLEDQIIDYRLTNFTNLNYKLITQPHSHRFNLINCRYLSLPCKGNIQDLLSAADLYSFSFQVFMKISKDQPVQSARFVHVDRWGGETDKMECFFMRVLSSAPGHSSSEHHDELFSKWWHLTPDDAGAHDSYRNSNQIGDYCSDKGGRKRVDNAQIGDISRAPMRIHESSDDFVEIHRANLGIRSRSTNPMTQELRSTNQAARVLNTCPKSNNNTYSEDESSTSENELDKRVTSITNQVNPATAKESSHNNKAQDISQGNYQRKLKTVVEMYDEKSKRRKKYVYDGYLARENVLEALSLQGYIKKPSDYSSAVVKVNLNDSKMQESPTKRASVKRPSKNIVNTSVSSIRKHEKGNRENMEYTNLNELRNTYLEPKKLSSLLEDKMRSASLIALVDQESMERNNKFRHLHQRVAPAEIRTIESKKTKQKNCLRSFFSWASSAFKNNK